VAGIAADKFVHDRRNALRFLGGRTQRTIAAPASAQASPATPILATKPAFGRAASLQGDEQDARQTVARRA
jgi:hypothetical protein